MDLWKILDPIVIIGYKMIIASIVFHYMKKQYFFTK